MHVQRGVRPAVPGIARLRCGACYESRLLVRIALKRAYSDGTVAVDMDTLSLLCRLAASVPPARYHIVVAGVLAAGEPVAKTNRAPAPRGDG